MAANGTEALPNGDHGHGPEHNGRKLSIVEPAANVTEILSDGIHGYNSEQNGRKYSITEPRSYGTANGATERRLSSAIEDEELYHPHGPAAWGFLAGGFFLEGLIWGLPFSYGIFEKYYSNHVIFSSESGIAAIGTTCTGLAYFTSPVVFAILQRWPSKRSYISITGLFMMVVALIIASFATHVIHLVFTQGLLYGIGSALLYNPFLSYVDEWFPEGKGLAYSVFWAGTGFSGAVIPFVMEWALGNYGFRTTLRAWAMFIFITLAFLIYLLKPPRPLSARGVVPRMNFNFLRNPLFCAFQFGNIIEGLGYFVPQIYLITYAKSIGLSNPAAITSTSLLNIFSTVGLILIGILVDRYHISTVLLVTAITSTLSIFLLWGFALNEIVLYAFAITFGIIEGGFVSCWTGCAIEVKKKQTDADVAAMLGCFAAGRGFGCVLSGPISEYLLTLGSLKAGGAYGTKYGILIIFTGITAFIGRFGLLGQCGPRAKSPVIESRETTSDEEEPLLR